MWRVALSVWLLGGCIFDPAGLAAWEAGALPDSTSEKVDVVTDRMLPDGSGHDVERCDGSKVIGAELGAMAPLGLVGGSGGNHETQACPPGTLLVGFSSDWGEPWFSPRGLTNLVGLCQPVALGIQGEVLWTAEPPESTPKVGSPGVAFITVGAYDPVQCPEHTYIVGAKVFPNTVYVEGLALACVALSVTQGQLQLGPIQSTAVLGQTTAQPTILACPLGSPHLAGGFEAMAGEVVDAFTLLCGPVWPRVQCGG